MKDNNIDNKIKLSDIIEKCLIFRENPTEEAFADIGDVIASVNVRERLSLAEKGLTMLAVMERVKDTENPVECAFQLTAGFFFKGTLSYATNLAVDIPLSLMNIEVYDLLVTMGLEDHILEYCAKDNAALRKMLDDAVNCSNVYRLVNAAKMISPEGIAELDKVLKGLKESLTLDKIRELKSVLAETDPAWTALKETVGEDIAFARAADEVKAFEASMENGAETASIQEGGEGDGESDQSSEGGE